MKIKNIKELEKLIQKEKDYTLQDLEDELAKPLEEEIKNYPEWRKFVKKGNKYSIEDVSDQIGELSLWNSHIMDLVYNKVILRIIKLAQKLEEK